MAQSASTSDSTWVLVLASAASLIVALDAADEKAEFEVISKEDSLAGRNRKRHAFRRTAKAG